MCSGQGAVGGEMTVWVQMQLGVEAANINECCGDYWKVLECWSPMERGL